MTQKNNIDSSKETDNNKTKNTNLDHLLLETFKDDMPAEVERAMKKQLDQFRQKMEQTAAQKTGADRKMFRGAAKLKDILWAHFLFRKEALLVVSLLMIVLGSFIQSSGFSNQLSENLSVLGTSVVVSDQMNRSHSMVCSIQMPQENAKPLHYSIQWLSPNMSKIQVKDYRDTLLKTLWFSEEDIVIADHMNDRVYRERYPAHLNDPMIQPIRGYLTPMELRERMSGEWKFKQTDQKGERGLETFTVLLPDEKALLEVVVDLHTYLPVSIKKILPAEEQGQKKIVMHVQYTWNVPLSPENLSTKPINESQNA